jgi:hypothetical protein
MDEAASIVERGRRSAANMCEAAAPHREAAVARMIELLLAPPSEKGK